MHRLLCCLLAATALLAGCGNLQERPYGTLDDDEDTTNAAAFLGYHGPVHEDGRDRAMGGPP